jgi:uncharacterized damage-inducible protein DinB
MSAESLLARYKAWADAVFLSIVAELPEHELIAPRAIGFGSLIRTIHHSYCMDVVWQAHLSGRPHGYTTRNPVEHPAIGELVDAQRRIDAWYVDHAQSLSSADLADVVDFEFIGGGRGAMTRSAIILHVVNHTTYHRGQAADILYHLGVFPPATDLPVFLRLPEGTQR